MRKMFLLAATLVVGAVSCARFDDKDNGESQPSAVTFFVATNGNDAWSGTQSKAGRNDGPFLTMERALKEVQSLKVNPVGHWPRPVNIFVRGGIHHLSKPVVLTPTHSGTATAPLTIAAYRDERPVLSAGRTISGWKETTVADKKLWVASLPEVQAGNWFFRQLWINGERRTRARHPNSGYFKVMALPDATSSWEHGHKRFQFDAGNLYNWKSVTNGEAVAMTRWVESRMPITGIDEEHKLLTSSKRSVFQLQPGDPYYIEHVFEALDQPGEWYLDRAAGLLYYFPFPNENLNARQVIAPLGEECLRLDGTATNRVQNVVLRGLTFSHNEWYYPTNFGSTERHISSTPDPEIFGSAQAAFIVPGAVRAEFAHQCVFQGCNFANIGGYALQLGRGCQSNRVSRCDFSDLGAGGIRLGETLIRDNPIEQPHSNEVSDCHIRDGGKLFVSGEGIWIGQSHGNRILHNAIYDFYYTGISIGWTWGYEPSLASNNIVEFNHVHHLGQKSNGDGPILSDMGGIYTLGMQPGTVIRNNLWHDIYGLRYGGWAIYFDEGSSFIHAENNVAFRTTHGGFHQHYGKENIVRNNVFAYAHNQQLHLTRPEGHRSFTFEKNIVYYDQGKLLEGDWSNGKYTQDYNVYFDTRTNANLNFPGGWDKWRQDGHDVHSIISDPRFSSTNLAAFSLQPDSPAWSLGFQRFDLKGVGPRTTKAK